MQLTACPSTSTSNHIVKVKGNSRNRFHFPQTGVASCSWNAAHVAYCLGLTQSIMMHVLPKPVQSCTQALCTARNEVLTANEAWPWIPRIRGNTNSVGSCLISQVSVIFQTSIPEDLFRLWGRKRQTSSRYTVAKPSQEGGGFVRGGELKTHTSSAP